MSHGLGGRGKSPAVLLLSLLFPALVLSGFGDQVLAEPATDPKVDQLGALLADPKSSDRAKVRAARILARSNDPRAVGLVFAAIRDRALAAGVRAAVTRDLGRSPQKDQVSTFLKERLEDRGEVVEVRASAATSLGMLKMPANQESLRLATSDSAPEVRLAARLTLLEFGNGSIERAMLLRELLEDRVQPGPPRAWAAGQLADLKDPRALPWLLAALKEPAPEIPAPRNVVEIFERSAAIKAHVPAAAARALGRLGDTGAIPPLLALAQTPNVELRVAVFEALATLKARLAQPAALAALSDSESRVRRWAALLLKEVEAKDALPDLRRALRDPDAGVRLEAAQALGRMRDQESVKPLDEALQQESVKTVREALETALRSVKQPAQ